MKKNSRKNGNVTSAKITLHYENNLDSMMLSFSTPSKGLRILLNLNKEQMMSLFVHLNNSGSEVIDEWEEGQPDPEIIVPINGEYFTLEYGVWENLLSVVEQWISLLIEEEGDDVINEEYF